MITRFHKQILLSLTLSAITSGWAQTADTNTAAVATAAAALQPPPPLALNRVGLSYLMGVNISADFKNLGGLAGSNPGPAVGSAVNRNYDDGYNRVDSSGNAGGQTWYWGYQSPNSVQGGNLVLQSYSSPANAVSMDNSSGVDSGVGLTYSRELYRREKWRAGVEALFGYTHIAIADDQTLKNTVYRTNDSFALNETVPPLPPYNGTFQGPGPVISSTLTPGDRTVTVLPQAATITGSRDFDTDVFIFQLGPYLEVPLSQKFSFFLSGGLTLVVGNTDFSFQETVTISDPAYGVNLTSPRRVGEGSQTDFLVGGYVGGRFSYALTKEVSLFAGAQFQAAGQAVNQTAGKEAVLDLGQSVIVSIGASYSF